MSIKKEAFGVTKQQEQVTKYTLENKNGMKLSLLDLGAVITNLWVPDRAGKFEDVVLGFDSVAEYEVNRPAFGAVIGRVANRIGNASFTLNGKEYKLDQNDGPNCLHGGFHRLEHCMYQVEYTQEETAQSLSFSRMSKDMEQGFPGNALLTITYTLNDDNEMMIEYHAVSDEDTVVSLTNHCYFNLGKGGHKGGTVLSHTLQIFAESYTPSNEMLLPTGEICPVAGTALDFRTPHVVGERIGVASTDNSTVVNYDHNFVLDSKEEKEIVHAVTCSDTESGRTLEVYTDFPAMQLYAAGDMVPLQGKDDTFYEEFSGICFETQNFPNAVNMPEFPSAVLRAGEEYERLAIFRFGVNA